MFLSRWRGRRRALVAAAAIVTAGALAACSSGSGSGSGAAGTPITVYTVGPFTSQSTASFDEVRAAAEATAKSINDAGGVNGRPLQLETCDDQLTPTVAQRCYQTAVDSDAVAVLGGYNVFGASIIDLVDKANMPMVGTAGGLDAVKNANWFPLTTATINAYNVAASQAVERGAKKVALLVSNTPGGVPLADAAEKGVVAGGGSIVAKVPLAATEANTGPAVETLLASQPDAIIFAVSALQTQSALDQLQRSAFAGKAYVQTTLSTQQNIEQLSKFPFVTGFQAMPPVTDRSVPGVDEFRSVMEKYAPQAPTNELALNTFLAFKAFAQVAGTINGDVTRQSVNDAFTKASSIDTLGLTPDIPGWFTGTAPDPAHPRLFTNYGLLVDVKDGQLIWDKKWVPGLGGGAPQTAQ